MLSKRLQIDFKWLIAKVWMFLAVTLLILIRTYPMCCKHSLLSTFSLRVCSLLCNSVWTQLWIRLLRAFQWNAKYQNSKVFLGWIKRILWYSWGEHVRDIWKAIEQSISQRAAGGRCVASDTVSLCRNKHQYTGNKISERENHNFLFGALSVCDTDFFFSLSYTICKILLFLSYYRGVLVSLPRCTS